MKPPTAPKPHPRLFVPEDGFAALKNRGRSDPVSRRIFECLRRKADQFCAQPVLQRELEGRRLLAVSRTCLERVLTLAMTARLTDEGRYAERATAEMLAIAAFSDWNPSHFLDVAEMTLAMAVGYDWLFDILSAGERETVADAILKKGIDPSLSDPEHWWVKGTNNWNQVCHAGTVAGALALADRFPDLAAKIVARAVANVPHAAAQYAPDGAYAEGPNYWGYGTEFHVALIDALESALGDSHALADAPGFLESADYIMQITDPAGRFFNYSDSREERGLLLPMFWFARRRANPALVRPEIDRLDEFLSAYERDGSNEHYRLLVLTLLWHQPTPTTTDGIGTPPLHWLGRGTTPVGVHRSSWHDPAAIYVALKGGSPSTSHAHMDAGAFVLGAGGVRWAVDLGMQDYHSLEKLGVGLWEGGQDGERWKVFRLGAHSHNVPVFNGAAQLVSGHAPVVRFRPDGAFPHTVVDLTPVYSHQMKRVWRGVALLPDGRVLLQDEWTAGNLDVEARWQMFTRAEVRHEAGRITLAEGGRMLELQIAEGSGYFAVEVVDASKPVNSYDAPNPGVRALALTCHLPAGKSRVLRIVATLLPSNTADPIPLRPLEEWSSPLA